MISVTAALEQIFALVTPLPTEMVPLRMAAGRVLSQSVAARRDQPPFAASAMDGYAIRKADLHAGASLRVIGESAAGRGFGGRVTAGTAVRILTGAPLPDGADFVVIQEDVTRSESNILLGPDIAAGSNIRPAGNDFRRGDSVAAPRRLSPSDIALLAAMNIAEVPVTRKPVIAIIATGDELVQPGETPGPDQIIASNSYGLHALCTALGAAPRLLPIARDDMAALDLVFDLASGADLVLTIGGASVGDHDLVAQAVQARGHDLAFHKVALRPGKPLMAGRIDEALLLGLPGNPVSAMVCGTVFLGPVILTMLGLPAQPAPRLCGPLAETLPPNGPREHYLRATRTEAGLRACGKQDSALLSVLAQADCLIVQPPHDPGRPAGAMVEYIAL
ncbi:MAG: molybdopterin molybdotransferase MoeA [Rhodobacterales bacterium]|nr:molybdopterin molybdotransferase MoeA [Rhodobacterales bacterium]